MLIEGAKNVQKLAEVDGTFPDVRKVHRWSLERTESWQKVLRMHGKLTVGPVVARIVDAS